MVRASALPKLDNCIKFTKITHRAEGGFGLTKYNKSGTFERICLHI